MDENDAAEQASLAFMNEMRYLHRLPFPTDDDIRNAAALLRKAIDAEIEARCLEMVKSAYVIGWDPGTGVRNG